MARLGCRVLLNWCQSQLSTDKNHKHHYKITNNEYTYKAGTNRTFGFSPKYCYIKVAGKLYEWDNSVSRFSITSRDQDTFSSSIIEIGNRWNLGYHDIILSDYSGCCMYTILTGIIQAMNNHSTLRKYVN